MATKKHPFDAFNDIPNHSHIRNSNANITGNDGVFHSDEDTAHSVNLLLDDSDDSKNCEFENKSIDSDKTEEPLYPWDAKPKSDESTEKAHQQRQSVLPMIGALSAETKTPTNQESPTTKTLNTFSQNVDDLQCKSCIDNGNDIGFQIPPTNAISPPEYDLPHGYDVDWEIHLINIVSPRINPSSPLPQPNHTVQPLGAVIVREAFPMTANCGKRQTQRNHCLVKRLREDGLAIRCRLQEGDWFLRPMDMSLLPQWSKGELTSGTLESAIRDYETNKDPPKLATFDEIQKWSKESYPRYRPIRVLRKRTRNIVNKRTVSPASCPTTTILQKIQTSSKEPHSKATPTTDSSNNQTKSLPPYCVLCNYYNPSHWSIDTFFGKMRTKPKRPPRNHHAWCPKHKEYDRERVEKRLARTKHCYRVLGCEACHIEYQTGKVISIKKKAEEGLSHNEACLLYQEMLKNQERLKHKHKQEEERQRKKEAAARKKQDEAKKRKLNSTRTMAQQRDLSKRARNRKPARAFTSGYESSSNNSSSDSGNSDHNATFDDGSIYQPPTRKAKIEAFTYPRKRKEFDSKKKAVSAKRNPKSKSRNQEMEVDEKLHRFGGTAKLREKTGDESPETTKQGTRNKKDDNERVKPVWVPLYDNPWGEEGYQMGDVLLFGPQLGTGHHETHDLSTQRRYTVNPFGNDSAYRSTHRTPAEGLSLILLKRDSMGRMPWGFQPVRDEFKNACLVESVDPCSPASRATFLGVDRTSDSSNTNSSALNVNDMVVLINGKPVGGMTEVGLELELEMSAPNLLLGVSRYKHAQKVARRFAEMERKMLDFMDRAARDDRLMGWREIGCANGIDQAGLMPVVPPSQPKSKLHNNQLVSGELMQRIDEEAIELDKIIGSTKHIDSLEYNTQTRKNGDDGLEHNVTDRENQSTIAIQNQEDRTHAMSSTTKYLGFAPEDDCNLSLENSEDSAAHDENPQMGCVCGAKHSPSPTNTFWIQCESCNSWYHVARDCVGFDNQQANCPDFVWNCPACVPDAESDEDIAPSKNSDGNARISQPNVAKQDHSKLDSQDNTMNHTRNRKIHSNHSNGGSRRSLSLPQKPSDDVYAGTSSHPKINSSQDLACKSLQSGTGDVSNNASKSSQSSSLTFAQPLHRSKFSNVPTQISAQDGPKSPSTPPRTPKKSSEEERQNKNKSAIPLALKQLKSYNCNGLGYWENFESKRLPGNHHRCLRKRKDETNKHEQHQTDKGHGDKTALKKKKKTTCKTNGGKEKSQALSSRTRKRSTRKRVESKTERDGPSFPTMVASEKADGETTIPAHFFAVADLVFVESHAWSYVNNSGGIGWIQKAYISDDGDRVYDVKYPALNRTEKMIMAEFISLYSFD